MFGTALQHFSGYRDSERSSNEEVILVGFLGENQQQILSCSLPVYFKLDIFISVTQKKSIHTLSKHLLGTYYRLVAILALGYSPELNK